MDKPRRTHWVASEEDKKSQLRLIPWSLAWVLAFLGVNLAMRNDWIDNEALAILATLVVTTLGLGVLLAYRRSLAHSDELMRKVQLDALALTVGVGVVAGFSYALLEQADLVADAEVLTLVVMMVITYIAGVVVGLRRFS